MSRSRSRLHGGLFAVVFLGVLGLGATQARAEPGDTDFLACSPELGQGNEYCNDDCIQQGGLGGFCNTKSRQCACLFP